MKETIDGIIQWHTETFPEATIDGQKGKWEEEFEEFTNTSSGTTDELFELADLIIVSCGIMRFDYAEGFNHLSYTIDLMYSTRIRGHQLWLAVEQKMAENRKRKWCKGNGNYRHTEE